MRRGSRRFCWHPLTLLLVLACASTGSVTGGEGLEADSAWERILEGSFELSPPAEADPLVLEAAVVAARTRAEYAEAFDHALALFGSTHAAPEGELDLHRLARLARAAARQDALRKRLLALIDTGAMAGNVRAAAIDWLRDDALRHRRPDADDGIERWVRADGYLRTWARVAGPFEAGRPFRLEASGPVEHDPAADVYTDGEGAPVRIVENVRADRRGRVRTGALLGPRRGAAYLIGSLRIPAAREVVLSFEHGAPVFAWLDGVPLHRGPDPAGYRPRRWLRRIRLDAGVHTLILRTRAGASPRVRMLDTAGAPLAGVKALAWKETRDALAAVRGLEGYLAGAPHPEPVESRLLREMPVTDAPRVVGLLHRRARTLELLNRYPDARAVWEAIGARAARSAWVDEAMGLFLSRQKKKGADAPQRLQKEAASRFERARQRRPDAPRVLYMKALEARRNGAADQAIDLLLDAVEFAPAFGQALALLGTLEAKEGLGVLAEDHLRAARTMSAHASAGRRLLKLMDEEKRVTEASALARDLFEAGVLAFPAYAKRLADAGRLAEVEALAEEYVALYPRRAEQTHSWIAGAARAAAETDREREALEAWRAAVPWAVEPCRRLAGLAIAAGQTEAAAALLQDAIARRNASGRGTPELRRRLRALTGAPAVFDEYDLSLEEIDAAAYTAEAFPTAHHADLLHVVVHHIQADRSVETMVHRAVKVFDKHGIRRLGELQVPSDPDDLHYSRTIGPDGEVFLPTTVRRLDFSDAASMYNVSPGAILEYAFRRMQKGGEGADFSDRFAFERFDTPVASARWVVVLPAAWAEDLSVRTFPADFIPRREDRGAEVAFVWEAGPLDPVRRESHMDDRIAFMQSLRARLDAPSWSDPDLFRLPEPVQDSRAIRQTAREVVEGAETAEEKLLRLHAHVRGLLKPSGGAETPRDVHILQSGDPAAVRRYMRALLAAVGIPSSPAYANTAYTHHASDPRVRGRRLGRFNVPLLRVDLDAETTRWLRFFQPVRHYRPLDLGYGVPGAPALVREQDGLVVLDRVRAVELEKRSASVRTDVHLQADGTARVEASVRFVHTAAASLRAIAEQPQAGPRRLEAVAKSLFPRLVVTESDYPPPDLCDAGEATCRGEAFVYRFSGTVEGFLRDEGAARAFDLMPQPFSRIEDLLGAAERRTPLRIAQDIDGRHSVTFHAPEGWVFTGVPEGSWLLSDRGLYTLCYAVRGRTLRVSRGLLIPAQTVAPEHYTSFARWLEDCRLTEAAAVATMRPAAEFGGMDARSERVTIRPVAAKDLRSYRTRWWPLRDGQRWHAVGE